MNITDTTKEFLLEIQNELKAEDSLELSIQEIAEIVESQFIGATYGIKRGIDIRLPRFGVFARKFGRDKSVGQNELKALKDTMSKDEYDRKLLDKK